MNSNINEAVILAGGLGTRLRGVINEIPKPMAPVRDKPFLYYVLQYLEKQNISKAVLAVGYKYEVIKDYFGDKFNDIDLIYAIEDEPLGTGGAIKNATENISNNNFILINGDTFFNVDIASLTKTHLSSNADVTLSLKEMHNFDRYGSVELEQNSIKAFNEKKQTKKGLINGGVYAVNKNIFNLIDKKRFSFEQEILEAKVSSLDMKAYICDGYFIDIGIPEDYEKAQIEVI